MSKRITDKKMETNYYSILGGVYWDNGKGNGNYYSMLEYIGLIILEVPLKGLYWGFIGAVQFPRMQFAASMCLKGRTH